MKAITSCIILSAASAAIVCAAEPAPFGELKPNSAGVQTIVKALQLSSAPIQITFGPPRAAPAASPGEAGAAPNVPPKPRPEDHGTRRDYVRVIVFGKEVYCRNDIATGSHLAKNPKCRTGRQLEAEQARAQDYINKVQRVGAFEQAPMYMRGTAPQ
jgi:hypothetical protein